MSESAYESLLQEARDIPLDFCANKCKSKCCKMGHLAIPREKKHLFPKHTELDNTQIIAELTPKCQNLDEKNQCKIYKERPQTCSDFPVFLRGKTVFIASSCKAVEEGMLDEYQEQFVAAGLKVIIQ